MYNSPIKICTKLLRMTQDETIVRAVQDVGIFVDKDELIKALQYDRGQYDKGYADGQKDAKEAQNIDPESLRPQVRCRYCSKDDGTGLQWDFEDIEVSVTLRCGVLTISNQYGEEAEMPINFCPICGARLKKDVDA